MLNFLLGDPEVPETPAGNGWTQWVILGVLLVGVIVLFVLNHFRGKKDNERAQNMAASFKPGDRVRTGHGIYGKIIEINETTYGKVVLLETGDDTHKGYITVDLIAIAGIDEKKAIIYDLEGNPIVEGEEPVATEEMANAPLPEIPAVAESDEIGAELKSKTKAPENKKKK